MKQCGLNTVRIAESTWGYQEPQDGVFNLDYLGELLDKMHAVNIKVIVGTPTYAFPTWLAKKHPEVLIVSKDGSSAAYGARQKMDVSHPTYRFYAERMIRKLIAKVYEHLAVIGYQLDNETKNYNYWSETMQRQFLQHLKSKFETPNEMNLAYGFHYWSNSVNAWEDMPSAIGTINGSLASEYAHYQRLQVTDFLKWQASIVSEYKREDQFITQNFDLGWKNGSHSVQSAVDHFESAEAVEIAGIDIYHDTQDELVLS